MSVATMVEAFQLGGFHSLSQGVRDLCQLNALCAPSSHQSGESGPATVTIEFGPIPYLVLLLVT